MPTQSWKNLERHVAKILTGQRIPRGANFSRSLPDVVAQAKYSIARADGMIYAECKYSCKNTWVPKFEALWNGKLLQIPSPKFNYIFFPLTEIHLLSDPTRYKNAITVKGRIPKFITSHIEQSRYYVEECRNNPITRVSINAIAGMSPTLPVLPIVVLAKKGKQFRLAYTTDYDLNLFYSSQNDKNKWLF